MLSALLTGLQTGTCSSACYFALGSGQTSPDLTDVSLENQVGNRQQITRSYVTRELSGDSYTLTLRATVQGADYATNDLYEAGIFSSAAGDSCLARVIFGKIELQATDIMEIQWDVIVSPATSN